jgi:hypothetical protein
LPKRRPISLGIQSLLVVAVAAPAGIVAAQATPSPAARTPQSMAIVVAATKDPLRVTGSDGSDHLEYDLLVTNAIEAPVTLTSIEVVAPDGETLLHLEGDALVEATQLLFSPAPTREISASETVAVVVDVVVPPDLALERLTHRIAYELAPDAPDRSLIDSFAVDGPELAVDPRRATVLAPPLRGDGWLAANGCCSPDSGHRAVRIAVDGAHFAKTEMFSIDWIRLHDGRLFAGDGARSEQWFGYGAEVLAVADGTVVAVRDGLPEETPNEPVQHVKQPGDAGGNSVVLAIAPGVYAFYAHLQPGSITVKEGDRVTAGEPIGLLGNSGQSTAPHLHVLLIDSPDPVTANSLPMVFDRYTLVGEITSAAFDAAATGAAGAVLIPEGTPRHQSATLPLDNTVVNFP